jgi:hypothetical protein
MAEVMRGSRGLLRLVFVGIMFKLNVLKNPMGIWGRLNT